MTYLEIQNDALRALNLSTAASSDPRTRVKGYINLWHRRILSRPGYLRRLRDRQLTLTSVADQSTYPFGSSVARVNGITDTTNDQHLVRRDLSWLRRADPGLEAEGVPVVYIDLGRSSTRLLQVQLWPPPQSAYAYTVDYTAALTDLTDDADLPLLPDDFHHVLSLGAQHDEWRRMDDDRAGSVWGDIEYTLKSLNAYIWDLPDTTDECPVGRPSRLGAWFPSDRGRW